MDAPHYEAPRYEAVRALGLTIDPDAPQTITRSGYHEGFPAVEIHAVRPARRVTPSGEIKTDLVILVTQKRYGFLDRARQREADAGEITDVKGEADFVFRGGATLLLDLGTGDVRFLVRKGILDEDRLARQRRYLRERLNPALRGVYFGTRSAAEPTPEPFAFLHRSAP